jgi:hypothetical protein
MRDDRCPLPPLQQPKRRGIAAGGIVAAHRRNTPHRQCGHLVSVWCLPARLEPPARIVCQAETRSGELIDQDDVSLS